VKKSEEKNTKIEHICKFQPHGIKRSHPFSIHVLTDGLSIMIDIYRHADPLREHVNVVVFSENLLNHFNC